MEPKFQSFSNRKNILFYCWMGSLSTLIDRAKVDSDGLSLWWNERAQKMP